MLSLYDKVVYPGHGVAQVSRIFEKTIGTQAVVFFELKFINKDITVMIPDNKLDEVGLRKLSSKEYIFDIYKMFMTPAKRIDNFEAVSSNWNKRNKEYQLKLRTGSLFEVSEIYKELKSISYYKDLSFGEKNLLQKTEALLIQEISFAQELDEEEVREKLRSFFIKTYTSDFNSDNMIKKEHLE